KMIAGVVIFRCNPQVILAFYISHDDNFQAYRPVNLLFYEIIRWGIEHRYSYLDYGIYTVNMDPNFGLAKFKESFGAVGIFRDTYFIEI
ncbi:GNAT family N-acetyltransferase, partial [bacterium]|nr:GNAT family N-acetyltransferase [bacterium]